MTSTKNIIYYVGIAIVVANNLSQTFDALTTWKWSFILSLLVVIIGIVLDEKQIQKLR